MTRTRLLRFSTIAAIFVLGLSTVTPAPADAPAAGDLWEVTSQMTMEGMPMAIPASKTKVCSAKTWTEPPGGSDERRKCTTSDFKVEGPKATWKVTCAGPPAMTGAGEITREGADSWNGGIKFTGEAGSMNLKLSGKRLGDCEKPQ